MTYLISGFRPGGFGKEAKADYSRIGELSTDTGSRPLTRRAARDLAINLCATAEKGLGVKSNLDPALVIDNPEIPVVDLKKHIGARASDICVIQNSDVTFIIRFNGPDDILDENSLRRDEEAFRLNITLGQNVRESQ